MLSYVKHIINSNNKFPKRKDTWANVISKKIYVKPDKALPNFIMQLIIDLSNSLVILENVEDVKNKIFEILIPSLKIVLTKVKSSLFFNKWRNVAKTLYTNLGIHDIEVLYMNEIPISSYKQYSDWVCTFSKLTMDDNILFPSKASEECCDLEFIFDKWLNMNNKRGFPQRFKNINIDRISDYSLINLFREYGIKAYELFPALIIKEQSIKSEIEYLKIPLYISYVPHRKRKELIKRWQRIHPNFSLDAAFIYANKYLDKEYENIKALDSNGFSLAMCFVITHWITNIESVPLKYLEAHKTLFGDDALIRKLVQYFKGGFDRDLVKIIPVNESRHPEDRCPICYSDLNMCAELPCGHIVCVECLSKINSCMYRCESLSDDPIIKIIKPYREDDDDDF